MAKEWEPALVEHARNVLKLMAERANDEKVVTAKMTALVGEVAPTSYYTQIMRLLQDSGAIVQLRRGGGAAPSVFRVVNTDPELKTVDESERPTKAQYREKIERRVDTLEKLVGGIDVSKALADIALEVQATRRMVELRANPPVAGGAPTFQEVLLDRLREHKGVPAFLGSAEVYAFESESEEGLINYAMVFPNEIACTCRGFRFKGKCWHSESLGLTAERDNANVQSVEGGTAPGKVGEHEDGRG